MLHLNKTLMVCLVLIAGLASCKKDDAPKPSAANNTIVETSPPTLKGITININQYIGGYYESLPAHYQVTTKTYPLIIFLHGAGQEGDGGKDLPLVLDDGIAKLIKAKQFPADFNVNGTDYSFIVLSPQLRAMPSDAMVASFVDYAQAHYRIDPSRIYLAGISMGGVLTTEMGGHYTSKFAAIVPISGASFGADMESNASAIASGNLPLWAFHNSVDTVMSPTVTTNFVSLVNSDHPTVAAKVTIFPVTGHDAWTRALDPSYLENNMNIYEWMLQYHR